jgi:manganese/zinc/iron transport system permease protein
MARSREEFALAATFYDGLTEIEGVLTQDQINELDRLIGAPKGVHA